MLLGLVVGFLFSAPSFASSETPNAPKDLTFCWSESLLKNSTLPADPLLLIPYVAYDSKTAWLVAKGEYGMGMRNYRYLTFGNLEVFDIVNMKSDNSSMSARIEDEHNYVFQFPEAKSEREYYCFPVGSRREMLEDYYHFDSQMDVVKALFEKVEEYGPEPRK